LLSQRFSYRAAYTASPDFLASLPVCNREGSG
jgi:hypothetical protein